MPRRGPPRLAPLAARPAGHRPRPAKGESALNTPDRTPTRQIAGAALSWGGHFRDTVQLSLPLIVGQMAMITVWTADIVMLGWISTDALAGGIQGGRLFQPFFFITLGLTLAVSPLTAQALGAGSRRQARRVVRQGLWLAIIYGAAATVPMWFGEDLLLMLGQEEAVARNAGPFIRMLGLGFIPINVYFVLKNYISSHKRPIPPVLVTLFGAGLNVGLNMALADGLLGLPAMGIAGIGLATTITFLVMSAMLFVYMNTRSPFRYTRPFARLWRLDLGIMKRLLVVGAPIAFTLVCETGMFIFVGLYTGIFGTNAVAASGIANQIAAIFFMVPLSIGQATTIRIGHEAGAGRRLDTMRAGLAPVVLTVAICLVQTALLFLLAEPLIRFFLNPGDPAIEAVVALAVPMLVIVALFQVFDGLQAVFACALRGLNDTAVPALLSFLAYWGIGVTLAVVIATPLGQGAVGIWWGLLLGLLAGSIMLGARCLTTWLRLQRGGSILVA